MYTLLLVGLIVLLINIPFGYWRANVSRFSLQWFLAIHIPVPFIIGLRFAFHLGFGWRTYVVLVSAYFLGHQVGGLLNRRVRARCSSVSSCMVMDLLRCRPA
jgi:hypothetical protein